MWIMWFGLALLNFAAAWINTGPVGTFSCWAGYACLVAAVAINMGRAMEEV